MRFNIKRLHIHVSVDRTELADVYSRLRRPEAPVRAEAL